MSRVRLIPRLDVKGPNLIKGVHLEGLRVLGDPQEVAQRYYEDGADELLYVDIVASLYGRSKLVDIIQSAASRVFVPLTVAGGIRSTDDVGELLRSGADKVAINTAAVERPELIREVARRFGSQCMVLSIEAKLVGENRWEVCTKSGREKSGLDAVSWAEQGVTLGAGEILVTSIDREGTRRGFDVALTRAIADRVPIPVIASGGYGAASHLVDVVRDGHASAVAVADALHYKRTSLRELRSNAHDAGIEVRGS
jgi:cyclase